MIGYRNLDARLLGTSALACVAKKQARMPVKMRATIISPKPRHPGPEPDPEYKATPSVTLYPGSSPG